jgi:hypothetical protein
MKGPSRLALAVLLVAIVAVGRTGAPQGSK